MDTLTGVSDNFANIRQKIVSSLCQTFNNQNTIPKAPLNTPTPVSPFSFPPPPICTFPPPFPTMPGIKFFEISDSKQNDPHVLAQCRVSKTSNSETNANIFSVPSSMFPSRNRFAALYDESDSIVIALNEPEVFLPP